jgi:hypothetical protein
MKMRRQQEYGGERVREQKGIGRKMRKYIKENEIIKKMMQKIKHLSSEGSRDKETNYVHVPTQADVSRYNRPLSSGLGTLAPASRRDELSASRCSNL